MSFQYGVSIGGHYANTPWLNDTSSLHNDALTLNYEVIFIRQEKSAYTLTFINIYTYFSTLTRLVDETI